MAATPIPPILDQDRYVRYEPAALTTEFDVPFPYFGSDASELLVLVDGVKATGFTVLSRSADALASAVKPVEDAFVRLGSGVAGVSVEIYGSIRPRRTVQATAAFSTRDFNFVFSYVVAALREMWSQFTRAVQVPPGESTVILPAAAERAGKVLAFGTDGTPKVLEPVSAGLVETDSIVDHAVTRPKLGSDVIAELDGKQAAAELLAGIAALGPSLAAGDLIRATGPNAVERVASSAVGSAVDIAMLAMELADLKNSTVLASGWWAESYDTLTTLVLPEAVGPRLTGTATAPLGGTAANFNDGSTSTVWSAAIGNLTGSSDINARIAAKLDFGAAVDIARVDLSGWYTSNAAYAGTYWGLYTSTDGTTWTLYGAAIPVTGSPASVSRSVAIKARYVAVAASAVNVGDTVYISDLAVYGARLGGVSSNIDLTETGVVKTISAAVEQIPAMTAATTSGVTFSASGYYSGQAGYEPWRAGNKINGAVTTPGYYWQNNTASGNWLQVDFGTAKTINSYSVASAWASSAPTAWNLQGSNDGIDFVTIHSIRDHLFADVETKFYTIASPGSYRYYRLVFTAQVSSIAISVGELSMLSGVGHLAMDARFIGQDIGSVPATASVYALLQPVDAVTLGTDLKIYATRDGATWTQATTVEDLGSVGPLKLIRGVVDLTGQPVGQALAPRIVSTSNKSFKLHGHYIAGRAA